MVVKWADNLPQHKYPGQQAACRLNTSVDQPKHARRTVHIAFAVSRNKCAATLHPSCVRLVVMVMAMHS